MCVCVCVCVCMYVCVCVRVRAPLPVGFACMGTKTDNYWNYNKKQVLIGCTTEQPNLDDNLTQNKNISGEE